MGLLVHVQMLPHCSHKVDPGLKSSMVRLVTTMILLLVPVSLLILFPGAVIRETQQKHCTGGKVSFCTHFEVTVYNCGEVLAVGCSDC